MIVDDGGVAVSAITSAINVIGYWFTGGFGGGEFMYNMTTYATQT